MVNKNSIRTDRHVTERAAAHARLVMRADQVRVAYGTVPVILAGLPSDHPVPARIRVDARALLLRMGYLTEAELGTLSVTEATRAALRRFRGSLV